MSTAIIITGGTIDSYFDPSTDSVKTLEKTCLPQYIKSLKTGRDYIYIDVCM
jgi:L-asparaginase/Glu-tRNA(Gln) amidotransferase subunit D